jgi:hypothetical protein
VRWEYAGNAKAGIVANKVQAGAKSEKLLMPTFGKFALAIARTSRKFRYAPSPRHPPPERQQEGVVPVPTTFGKPERGRASFPKVGEFKAADGSI